MGSKIKKVKIGPAVREFMASDKQMQHEDGTRLNYQRTLDVLLDVTGSQLNACELRPKHMDKALAVLRYRRSEASLNNNRAHLRAFERFLHSDGYLSRGQKPTANIDNAKVDSIPPLKDLILTYEQAADCFRVAEETHPRERIMLALGLYACMRESEVLDLRWKFLLDRDGDLSFYREKQNAWHTIPLMPPLARELELWRQYMEANFGEIDPEWFVVCGRKPPGGTRIGEEVNPSWPVRPGDRVSRLDIVTKGIFARVGVRDLSRKGIHTLRRTGACMVLDHTRDIRLVQRILGHKSQQTTELYVQYRDGYDLLKEFMADYDPLTAGGPPARKIIPPAAAAAMPAVAPAALPDNVVPFTRPSDRPRGGAARWRAAR